MEMTDKKQVVFIAGPMGTPKQKDRFGPKAEYFRRKGYNVIDPTIHTPDWMDRPQAMLPCLMLMDRAHIICFLKGWEDSEGCQIEYRFAKYTEKTIIFEE